MKKVAKNGLRCVPNKMESWEIHEKYSEMLHENFPKTMFDWTPVSIMDCMATGKGQIWESWSNDELVGVGYTEKRLMHEGFVLCIVYFTSMVWRDYMQYNDLFDTWCKREGISFIEAYARPGFQKVLKPLGYDTGRVHLVKKL